MSSATIRLTMSQAVVRWLTQQFTEIEGVRVPLFAGVFGIFGHGNVTCFSEALETAQDLLPTWRGQNEHRWRSRRSASPRPSGAGRS
jgi:3D-(3,5/4)-trihydroxycyclohexane-1,2-dione acylhydrolase (decyclizing)